MSGAKEKTTKTTLSPAVAYMSYAMACGERASAQVAACFSQLAERPSRNRTSIEHALSQSQQQVLELGQELGGIAGTTITGVVLPTRVEDSVHEQAIDEYCYVINVGDSRTYHMRADAEGHWMAESLTRITRDHSERQNAIDTGEMLPDEANRCIPRNIITQCVGAPDGIQPDWYAARSTGRFIICSDGLHAQIDRELLADVAAAYGDPQVAADMLVQSALDAGGNDNVTVIVLDICGKSSDYSANDDWNVSKIDDHEDIGDLQESTLQTLRAVQ